MRGHALAPSRARLVRQQRNRAAGLPSQHLRARRPGGILPASTLEPRRGPTRLPHLWRAVQEEVELRDVDTPQPKVALTNARDLSEACQAIKPGLLFRTANPFLATPCAIPAKGHIHLLDLRHPEEYERDDMSRWRHLVATERVFSRTADGRSLQAQERHSAVMPADQSMALNRISVLDRERIQKGLLFRKMGFWISCKVLFWMMFDIARMQALVVREINAGGLKMLYELIIDTSAAELVGALNVVLKGVEAGQPVVFFCKLGKDRTGLVAALILSIMGARDVAIVLDYAKSDGKGRAGLGDLDDKREVDGIDRRQFSRAPAAAMLSSLNYIARKYGSVAAYLTKAGFGPDKQRRLQAALKADA